MAKSIAQIELSISPRIRPKHKLCGMAVHIGGTIGACYQSFGGAAIRRDKQQRDASTPPLLHGGLAKRYVGRNLNRPAKAPHI